MLIRIPRTRLEWADWIGTATGVPAALILASNIGFQGLAFCIFIVSVLCFIYVAMVKKIQGMLIMNVIFLLINIWGVWRWILAPLLGV